MRTKEFLKKVDHQRVVEAIRRAESKSSGQIQVHIHRGPLETDALQAAQKKFRGLGMEKTRHRNAVLIFIAPRAHKFAVVGDRGVHEKCGDALWNRIVDQMRQHFRDQHFTQALADAVHDLGEALAHHFPPETNSQNELPDAVSED
jgi:uncharacterized membrane protein